MSTRQLPTNRSPYTKIVYLDLATAATVRRRVVAEDLADIAFEDAPPIRRFPTYRRKRSHEGSYWLACASRHVRYESRFESLALMLLDFSGQVTGVSSNPFWLLWPAQTRPVRHAPDFFARRSDGSVVVVDVHPEALISEEIAEQHSRTRELCQTLGWDYQEFTSISPMVETNVSILSAYSRSRYAPPRAFHEMAEASVPVAADGAIPLGELVEMLSCTADTPVPLVQTGVLHLLWTRRLQLDLLRPINSDTRVWR